ncbi:glutathione S-transferase N-terminal domain-containing protein [uncultured Sphingomonas sp.]|uniref:glutathione S-transferase N-terminal domain-containing protein n=1 Tax=uncultured Sphingomonas sp. TaxID=158754 RepID=UPI0035CAB6E0
MTSPTLTLHHFPGACSQVSVCALEMAELSYSLKLVNLANNEQTGPEYLAISPLGKVPLLLIDGKPLTENSAILTYIAALRPMPVSFLSSRRRWPEPKRSVVCHFAAERFTHKSVGWRTLNGSRRATARRCVSGRENC